MAGCSKCVCFGEDEHSVHESINVSNYMDSSNFHSWGKRDDSDNGDNTETADTASEFV